LAKYQVAQEEEIEEEREICLMESEKEMRWLPNEADLEEEIYLAK